MSDRRASLIVFACAVAAYCAALGGVFVYDDAHAVRDNTAIRSLLSIPTFFWDVDTFSSLHVRMYRPVVVTTLAIDHAISGGAPWMFKLTNALIHGGCAALIFALARSLGVARAPGWFAALLFAVHPLASEAVNIVSARSDLLLALGILVGLRGWVAARHGSRAALCLVVLGAVVACGSKATGVVLPALCVLLELRLRDRVAPWRSAFVRVAPAAAVTLAYLVARKLALGMATASVPQFTGGHDVLNGAGRDLVTQFCLMAHVLPRFVAQSLVPVGLTLDPWIPLHDQWASTPVLAGWTALVAATAFALWAGRRRPAVLLGVGTAWLCALPWIVLPLNLPACEHRFYPSLAGLALVLSAALPTEIKPRARAVLAGLAVLGAFGTTMRSLDYRDPSILWRGVLAQHPRSVRGLCGLAIQEATRAHEAKQRGDRDAFVLGMRDACDLLERAIAVYPSHWAARRNLAEFEIALGTDGTPLVALVQAEALLAIEPDNPFYRLLASRSHAAVGEQTGDPARFDAAVDIALSCLEVAEPKGLVFRTAASARAAQGDLAAAVELLDRSVVRGLDHESVLLQRAEYLIELGRTAAARRDLAVVLSRNPFEPTARRLMQAASPGR